MQNISEENKALQSEIEQMKFGIENKSIENKSPSTMTLMEVRCQPS